MIKSTEVYVVLGSSGEYSTYIVWVAGVYDNKETAIKAAESNKADDRTNWVLWQAWNQEFLARHRKIGKMWNYVNRAADMVELEMPPEPQTHGEDTDYTVVSVPMNTPGRWDYQ